MVSAVHRFAPLLTLIALALPAPAGAATHTFEYNPFGSQIQVVPGGVVVEKQVGRKVVVTRIDEATGAQTALATVALDKRVNVDFDDANASWTAGDGNVAISWAQDWVDDSEEINPIGGDGFAGAPGTKLPSLHPCATVTWPAPVDLSGTVVAYGARTTCGKKDDFGERAKFDLTVHDLAANTDRVLATNVVLADRGVEVAPPYVAAAVGRDAGGEGYAGTAQDLRVYDIRTGALVTHVTSAASLGARTIDVDANGRLVVCDYDGKLMWAAAGDTALRPTAIACSTAGEVGGDRVFVTRGRVAAFYDLTTGARQPLGSTKQKYFNFDSDGERVAWAGATCRSAVVNVAPVADLQTAPFRDTKVSCPSSFGSRVTLRGRTANVRLTCPNGCRGDLQLYELGGNDLPVVDVAVDPAPGKTVTVKLPLDAATAAHLRRARKVQVTLYSVFTGGFHSGTRTVKRSG
jgi:hypothetical protein